MRDAAFAALSCVEDEYWIEDGEKYFSKEGAAKTAQIEKKTMMVVISNFFMLIMINLFPRKMDWVICILCVVFDLAEVEQNQKS